MRPIYDDKSNKKKAPSKSPKDRHDPKINVRGAEEGERDPNIAHHTKSGLLHDAEPLEQRVEYSPPQKRSFIRPNTARDSHEELHDIIKKSPNRAFLIAKLNEFIQQYELKLQDHITTRPVAQTNAIRIILSNANEILKFSKELDEKVVIDLQELADKYLNHGRQGSEKFNTFIKDLQEQYHGKKSAAVNSTITSGGSPNLKPLPPVPVQKMPSTPLAPLHAKKEDKLSSPEDRNKNPSTSVLPAKLLPPPKRILNTQPSLRDKKANQEERQERDETEKALRETRANYQRNQGVHDIDDAIDDEAPLISTSAKKNPKQKKENKDTLSTRVDTNSADKKKDTSGNKPSTGIGELSAERLQQLRTPKPTAKAHEPEDSDIEAQFDAIARRHRSDSFDASVKTPVASINVVSEPARMAPPPPPLPGKSAYSPSTSARHGQFTESLKMIRDVFELEMKKDKPSYYVSDLQKDIRVSSSKSEIVVDYMTVDNEKKERMTVEIDPISREHSIKIHDHENEHCLKAKTDCISAIAKSMSNPVVTINGPDLEAAAQLFANCKKTAPANVSFKFGDNLLGKEEQLLEILSKKYQLDKKDLKLSSTNPGTRPGASA